MVFEDDYHKRMREIMSVYYWNGGGKIRKQIYDRTRKYDIPRSAYEHLETPEEQLAEIEVLAKAVKARRKSERDYSRASASDSDPVNSSSNV
jgi:hypothetical protein